MAHQPHPAPSPDEACWKLAEYERHFNTIQAGIRGLASVWLLASFGAIATLLKRKEADALWLSAHWVIVAICVMGATGLALLWVVDQLVYHRLLNAVFIVGLKLEHDDHTRLPLHASMYASMPKRGFAALLSLFYVLPVIVLAAVAAAAAVHELSQEQRGAAFGLLALATVPALIGLGIAWQGSRERASYHDHAALFEDDDFTKLFAKKGRASGFKTLLEQYQGSPRGGLATTVDAEVTATKTPSAQRGLLAVLAMILSASVALALLRRER
jgi:hypothetical protein